MYAVGTRVRLTNTGDIGKVTNLLSEGMVQVYLSDLDMNIPVAEEFLERYEGHSTTKAKVLNITSKKEEAPTPPPVETQYVILKSYGIQLAFDPRYKLDGTPDYYDVYLINDTQKAVIYSLEISYLDTDPLTKNGKLEGVAIQNIGQMSYDSLNDAPIVILDIWEVTTQGTGSKQTKELKIKAKQFFKNVMTVPLLNKPAHWYKMMESFDKKKSKDRYSEEDLKTYTRRNATPFKKKKTNRFYTTHDVSDFANFKTEIDLHLENLTNSTKKYTNAEKLRIQLAAFDEYIYKAVELGVHSVFIIHGVGAGKLKDHVASRLIQNKDIKSFKNEYHPRYGFGATEVIIK